MITTIYVCMLAHTHAHTVNDKCMHTHTNQYNSSKSFEPFFFSPTKHHKKTFYGHKRYQDLVSLGSTFTYSELVWGWGWWWCRAVSQTVVFCCLALPVGLNFRSVHLWIRYVHKKTDIHTLTCDGPALTFVLSIPWIPEHSSSLSPRRQMGVTPRLQSTRGSVKRFDTVLIRSRAYTITEKIQTISITSRKCTTFPVVVGVILFWFLSAPERHWCQ